MTRFAKRLLFKQAAYQDASLGELLSLLDRGYKRVRWQKSATADAICQALHGRRWPLEEFVSGLEHDAPLFEQSHVNCKCSVAVSGVASPVVVRAY